MLDLVTHGSSIRDALNHVETGKKTWLWLGYSGSTDTLEVKSIGDKLGKMMKHTKPSEVLYGYARLTENSGLVAKYVFILWLGTSSLKSKTIEYIRNGEDISKLCKTIHLKISARDLSDVNWDEVIEKTFGNLNAMAPQDQLQLVNEPTEESPRKGMQTATDFKSMASSGIVAARIKDLYKQKTSSSYKPVNFVEELEAARAMPHDPVDPIQGASYERPDFKADIAKRDLYVEQSHPTKSKHSKASSSQRHGSVSHSASTKSNVSVSSVSMSTSSVQVKSPAVATTSVSILTENIDVDVNGRYDFDGICLFRFEKAMDDEITIMPGDKITNICRFDDKWLWGTTADGQSGRFPKSYVELFEANAKDL